MFSFKSGLKSGFNILVALAIPVNQGFEGCIITVSKTAGRGLEPCPCNDESLIT